MKTYFSLKNILNPSCTIRRDAEAAPTPRDVLLSDIEKNRDALATAYSGFDNVTDPDLIDCYIYEIDSTLKRYRFLLQQAQRLQLYEQYTACEAFDSYDNPEDEAIPVIPAISYSLSLHHN